MDMKPGMKKLIKRESQPYINMCPDLKRQYIITCEQDLEDIIEGFCPYYAVFWSNLINSKYWKGEHFKHRPEYIIRANLALEQLEAETKPKKTVSFDIFNEILFYEKNEKINQYDNLLDNYLLEDYFVSVVDMDKDIYTYVNTYVNAVDEASSDEVRMQTRQEYTQNLFQDLETMNGLYFF